MQLNKGHKADIVRAIMKDVPQVDYDETIREYVQAEAVKLLPPEVRALYDNPETRRYLHCTNIQARSAHFYSSNAIFWCRNDDHATTSYQTLYLSKRHWNGTAGDLSEKLIDTVYATVADLCTKAEAQSKARNDMEKKLHTMLLGIRTLKQAKTLLEVELHKYLPVEPPKDPAQKAAQASTALVPYVVANLREMGWPKDAAA